jgi:hypothetical protein
LASEQQILKRRSIKSKEHVRSNINIFINHHDPDKLLAM